MKTLLFFVVLGAATHLAPMETRAQSPAEIPLWPDGAPGAHGTTPDDVPSLTPYPPAPGQATGAAVIVCPGGGYANLATEKEGTNFARLLNAHGIMAFVLRYRLGTHGYRHPAMHDDASRAVRFVRANAARWQVDPHKIGIMGSSAGGHLAATALTLFDAGQSDSADPVERASSRPDFGVLCYPVITMTGPETHEGSRANLLGPDPDPGLAEKLSPERQVTAQTPPCFLWHTWEDQSVRVENALLFASALRAHGVRFDLHVYEHGGHGLGLGGNGVDPAGFHPWAADCVYWLRSLGYAR